MEYASLKCYRKDKKELDQKKQPKKNDKSSKISVQIWGAPAGVTEHQNCKIY